MGPIPQSVIDALTNEKPKPTVSPNLPPEWVAQLDMANTDALIDMLKAIKKNKRPWAAMSSRERRQIKRSIEATIVIRMDEGRKKMAEAGGNFIRDRLREPSFARRVLPGLLTQVSMGTSVGPNLNGDCFHTHKKSLSEAELMGKAMAHSYAEEITRIKKEMYGEPPRDSSVEGGDRPRKL